MRLDKYLKVSGIIKRRSVANEISSKGRIKVNGKTAKPSTGVSPGDVLEINFGTKTSSVKIVSVETKGKSKQKAEMYETMD